MYLIQKGALLGKDFKEAPLFDAAVGGSSAFVLRLLEARATLRCFSSYSWDSRLCFVDHVVRIGDVSLVQAIIKAEHIQDRTKAYSFAVAAAKVGHVPILQSLLSCDSEAFEGRINRMRPPIYYAVKYAQMEALHVLLSSPFLIDTLDKSAKHARSLAHVVARKGYVDIPKILMQRFPDSVVLRENSTSILH